MNIMKSVIPISVNGFVNVRVQYFGSFREMTDQNEEEVETSTEATVQELLLNLSSVYGATFKCEVFQKNGRSIRDDLMVSINGILADHKKIENTRVESGDVIMLMPIFIGGG